MHALQRIDNLSFCRREKLDEIQILERKAQGCQTLTELTAVK